jgi:predicted DNA-binding WGR domain protein
VFCAHSFCFESPKDYLRGFLRGTTCIEIDSVSNGEDYVERSRDQDDLMNYYIVNKKGNYLKKNNVELGFFLIYPFSENKAVVIRDFLDPFEFIDLTGKTILKKASSSFLSQDEQLILRSFHEKHAIVNLDYGFGDNPKLGFIDSAGKVVIKPQFDEAYPFSEKLALIRHKNKYGFIDSAGKVVIKPQFDEAYPFSEKLALIRQKNKYGFIDSVGKVVIKPQFDEAYPFSEGYAGIKVKNKYGFVDSVGKVVIKPQFDQIQSFREEVAAVEIKNKGWGFIDSAGKVLIKPQFDEAYSFSCGLAVVGKETPYV